jgi:hypothetical protein
VTVRLGLRAFATGLLGSAFLATGLGVPASGLSPVELTAAAAGSNPVGAASGGVSNVTFYYGGGTDLRVGSDLSALGHPSVVVTTPRGPSDQAAVAAIHSMHAKAYRYVQFYWAPGDADYEGIDLQDHPEWAFCGPGGRKLLGRKTNGGASSWYFLDDNEKAVRARLRTLLAQYKAQGWDGVMFDRGEAATQYAKDIAGHPVWDQRSTCTSDPYKVGARFADAYVSMLGLAHAAGLQTMMNNGRSPFDQVTPMRPDPANVSCQRALWSKCHFLSDIWSKVDLILNEKATYPKDELWQRTFAANQRSEQSPAYGHRTIGLITTASLGGARNQTRSNVYYAWSRIKLFDLAVSVNTGDGGCPSAAADAVCNQFGTYPELVDTAFGRPVDTRPAAQGCVRRSKIHCVWVRRYAKGMNLVNASATARTVTTGTSLSSCRYLFDVYNQKPLAGGKCVKSLSIRLPAWSGRPVTYSTQAYSQS